MTLASSVCFTSARSKSSQCHCNRLKCLFWLLLCITFVSVHHISHETMSSLEERRDTASRFQNNVGACRNGKVYSPTIVRIGLNVHHSVQSVALETLAQQQLARAAASKVNPISLHLACFHPHMLVWVSMTALPCAKHALGKGNFFIDLGLYVSQTTRKFGSWRAYRGYPMPWY